MSCLFNGIRTSSSGLLNLECDWVEFPSSVSATKKATLQEMPLKNINNYIAERIFLCTVLFLLRSHYPV